MDFSILAESFSRMESTSKRLELTQHMVDLFCATPHDVVARITYLLQGKLRPDFEGVELGVAEKLAVRAISKSSGVPSKSILEEYARGGDLGDAAAAVLGQKAQTTFLAQDITVERVYETLFRIARAEGSRSQDMKAKYISSLLNDASAAEARYIVRMLLGIMRLGVAENTMMDALAIAYTGDKANKEALEHAYNVSSDLGRVAQAVASGGLEGIADFEIVPFSPVRPMLADRARSEQDAMSRMGRCAAEYKLDGERVQVHIRDQKVSLFSRSLESISRYYPDIVERAPRAVKAKSAILEAEAVAVNEEGGEFLPFQDLMPRRRKHKIEKAVLKHPIAVNFFDVLYVDGSSCLGMSYAERRRLLEERVQGDGFARQMPMRVVENEGEMAEFLEDAINAGSEGLMLKMLDKPYRAGARGSHWLKLKREYRNELGDSLDLVVVGGFFGKGRRAGIYGTLLLASYDEESDAFTSTCKVGTGFTDEDLDSMYQLLHPRVAIRKSPRVDSSMEADVWFDPEIVIEVVTSEITVSPVHRAAWGSIRRDSGLALRFPKFTGKVRVEKGPEDASTNEEIIALYRGQKKVTGTA